MSKASAAAAEPSMEDILASIRKIITDDEPGAEAAKTAETAPQEDEMAMEMAMNMDTPEKSSEKPIEMDEMEMALAMETPSENIDEMSMEMAMGEMAMELPAEKADAVEEDVFELTEDMEKSAPKPSEMMMDDEDDTDIMFVETEEEEPARAALSYSAPIPTMQAPQMPIAAKEPLLNASANAAIASQFGALSNIILNNNARTLDDIVAEMLRPMLKSWLDSNLPNMVERMVREEIERVTRGSRH